MRIARRASLALPWTLLLGCGETVEPSAPTAGGAAASDVAPTRVRLFDLIEPGSLSFDAPPPRAARAAERVVLVSGAADDPAPWFASSDGNRPTYTQELGAQMTRTADGGVEGGALRLGPGVARDRSYAVLLLPAEPLVRYTVRGRVRLADNPLGGEASAREVLQVIEHERAVTDPTRTRRSRWGRAPQRHRVSRTLDPSGWDAFELTFLSRPRTRTLEIRLLHRSGNSEAASTWYDAVEVEQQPVSEPEMYEFLRARYAPRDGQEDLTPWRLRVALGVPDPDTGRPRARREYRDAMLLPPPRRLALSVRLPPAATRPQLHFHYGMLPESHGLDGDGAVLRVGFRADDAAAEEPIGSVRFDPKNDPQHRDWLTASMDLTTVAGEDGQRGVLSFWAEDIEDSETDVLDAVLLSTPRIAPAEQTGSGLNVLLIGVDTLRADRMSAFGYERDTTPHLRVLAERATLFPHTLCQAPWTLPSFSTIFTSMYPSAHGAGRGGHDEWTPIDPTTTALAEILSRAGYVTQGVTANHLISPSYGLDQGFGAYRIPEGWSMESAAGDKQHVIALLREFRSTPFFLFWHIMDPHLPYTTEDGFREEFTAADYEGRFKGSRGYQVPFQVLDPRPGRRWYTHEGPPPAPALAEDDERFVHDYYDAEIAETDAAIGAVLTALDELGLAERTIIALVADHGEGLGEHKHYHHGYTLFEDQVRIPMLVAVPGQSRRVIERPVGAIDLAPTLLGALGLPIPSTFEGVDRLAADAPEDDPVLMEYPTYDSSAQKAYVRGSLKYLHDPVFHTEALFDVAADPLETQDVRAAHPEFVAEARAALDRFRWAQLQKGRFHLRLVGKKGQRLRLKLRTDDLFDANFASRPSIDEHDFTMDLGRTTLELDTELSTGPLELVFWCRGREMQLEATLDGTALAGLALGPDAVAIPLPATLELNAIPELHTSQVGAPATGELLLWLEAGASHVLPVVPTPEEVEHLKALGYTK